MEINLDTDPFEDNPPLYTAGALAQAERNATAAERARIRQLALDEAAKYDQANTAAGVDWREGVCAQALRAFAALLEER